jgi:RNA polymerase sigma-70 factor (ECF subfamily)
VSAAQDAAADEADVQLMERVQADEPEAFGALYDRFGARAFRVAGTTVRDSARAEDIVQEAFLSVWRSRARYQPAYGSVGGWIMGIVRNRAIDAHRSNSRHDRRRASDEDLEERLAATDDLEAVAGERDDAAQLRETLARLPEAQREVIAFAYFGELSASEIARELGIPLGTVKGRMRLGLEKLRADPTL